MRYQRTQTNLVIMVAYESRDSVGIWKAFCAPYAITTQASSCRGAQKKIEELVELYEEGLEKYNYPFNLVYKELSDQEDKKILKIIWGEIKKQINDETKKAKDFVKFAQRSSRGRVKVDKTVASFYQPQCI